MRRSLRAPSLFVLAVASCGGGTEPVEAPESPPPEVAPSPETLPECLLDQGDDPTLVELTIRLPAPRADDRVEVYDGVHGRLYSLPGHLPSRGAGGDGPRGPGPTSQEESFPHQVWSAPVDRGCVGPFREEEPFPAASSFGSYWGRAAVTGDGAAMLFTGPFDTHDTYVAALGADGALSQWSSTTPIPPSPRGRRSLHQALVVAGRLFVLGGWYEDHQPSMNTIASAPLSAGGAVGAFELSHVTLPVEGVSFSAARCGATLYVARDHQVFRTTVSDAGVLEPFVSVVDDPLVQHVSYGGTGLACTEQYLALVDESQTHLYALGDRGEVILARRVTHPRPFPRRTVFAIAPGTFLVTTTDSGRIYRVAATDG